MFDFHNFLWVIPGVIFIHFYNKRRPNEAIDLSGWPYLFFLVFIAAFTWIPSERIISHLFEKTSLLHILSTIFVSLIFSGVLFLIIQKRSILKWITIPIYDNFYKKCVEWENKEILITLKNGKTYQGLLWKYPESPKSRHESQTISIVPFKSGYRTDEKKEVIWNTYYPKYEGYSDLVDMEIIIPRTEIITFGKFSSKTFEHFEKQKSKENSQST